MLGRFHRNSFHQWYRQRGLMLGISFACPLCCSGRRCDHYWHRGATLLRRPHLSPPLSRDEPEDVRILCFVVRKGEDGLVSFVGSRTLASGSGRCILHSLECRPVDIVGPGAGLGGWAGNLRPIHARGRRHEHCCPVTTITLRRITETTINFLLQHDSTVKRRHHLPLGEVGPA